MNKNEKLDYPDYCNEDVRCDEVCENGCPWLNEDGECNISNAMVYRELEAVRDDKGRTEKIYID